MMSHAETRPLHVLYVVHSLPPETWAGTEVYTLELARAMAERGHRVTILTRTAGEGSAAAEYSVSREHEGPLTILRMVHRLAFEDMRQTYHDPAVEAAFDELLERERPDVVHFQHLIHLSAGLVRVARARHLPAVVTLNDYWGLCARVQLIRPDGVRCARNMGHGCLRCIRGERYDEVGRASRWLPRVYAVAQGGGALLARLMAPPSVKVTRFFHARRVSLRRELRAWREVVERQPFVLGELARANLLVAPSRFLRDTYLATGRLDPARFIHSDYGMRARAPGAFERRPDAAGRVRFAFVGSLVWYKGIEILLEAMAALRGTRAVLHVHGAFDPSSDPFHARLAALAAGSPVEFRGRFDNDALGEVYRDMDALVVPSLWYENSPITIHEAFQFRTPVVTSDIGGMAELVEDRRSGRHFRVGDAADLARVLRELTEVPAALEALREFPDVKGLDQDAAETEGRYHALLAEAPQAAPSA